jgi:ABC-type sugar transport system permease subunit
LSRARILRASVPYWLLLPVVVVLGAILGYPIFSLVRLSFQHYTLFELIRHHGQWVGLHNFGSVLHDPIFWHTALRTIVFTAVNVGLTMVLGTLLALLFIRVSTWMRVLLTAGLVLVWAMPPVVAVQIFNWMTNPQNGVVNYALTEARFGDYFQHDWMGSTTSQLGLTTVLIVWGALPFIAITVYAALSQVPNELIEAAEIDGAGLKGQLTSIILPMAAPGIAATALLCVIFAWNEFFYAVQLNPVDGSTVPIWVTTNISTRGDFLAKLSAASVLACIPVVLAGWIAQKRMIRGLAMGAIK